MIVRSIPTVCGMLFAGALLLPLSAVAQAAPAVTPSIPPDALQQMEKLSGPGGPLQGATARLKRMSDPDAGTRPGDDKLSCEQIKSQFDDTREKHSIQRAKQEAARAAVEDDARQAQAEAAGPGAIAKGFFGGLGAVAAHATGTGDVYNEKLKAEAMATQNRRQDLQNRFAEESETSKALADRGRVLMNLGNAKGCKGLVYKP